MPTRRYPGNVEDRGDSFRVRLSVGGRRYRYTVRTRDRRVAEKVAREKARELEQLHARRAAGLPDAVRVSALLATFEQQALPGLAPGTQRSYRDSLKPIRAYFVEQLEDPLVAALHAKHVTGFLTWRRMHRVGDGAGAAVSAVSNRTVQKDRTVLHRIFALAERLEVRDGNPVARTTPPKADARDPVLLTDAEYAPLLAQCDGRPMLQLYVLTSGETGARCEMNQPLEARLRLKFPLNPLAGPGQFFIPYRCLGSGCAVWAVRTARALTLSFFERLGGRSAWSTFEAEFRFDD